MVVIAFPAASDNGVTHERRGSPSKCTVQMPQMPTPQPYFVPLSPRYSRNTQSNGISAAAATAAAVPLTVRVKVGWSPPRSPR